MAEIKNTPKIITTGIIDPGEFLATVGDDELLRFLRRLPMVGNNENGDVTMADLTYEMKIWPFVKQAWREVQGSPGLPGRLLQLTRVYQKAESDFARETGEHRRLPRVIDLAVFKEIYAVEGLP